jgi:hypothetical protein
MKNTKPSLKPKQITKPLQDPSWHTQGIAFWVILYTHKYLILQLENIHNIFELYIWPSVLLYPNWGSTNKSIQFSCENKILRKWCKSILGVQRMYVDNMAKHKQTKRKQIVEDDACTEIHWICFDSWFMKLVLMAGTSYELIECCLETDRSQQLCIKLTEKQ